MDDEEWAELARIVRDHLQQAGLHEIADFDTYADEERQLPAGRDLVKAMLDALQNDLELRDPRVPTSQHPMTDVLAGLAHLKAQLFPHPEEQHGKPLT